MFSITFDRSATGAAGQALEAAGTVTFGDLSESFHVGLERWSEGDYLTQWREGVARIVRGEAVSCLVTWVPARDHPSEPLSWFALYRDGGRVFLQEHVIPGDQIDAEFDPKDPYRLVLPREVARKGATRPSEWVTSVEDLRSYLDAQDRDG
jgi:hypothetical protein